MTCISVSAQQGAVRPWTHRPKLSVIQRPQAVESHNEGHTPIRGRARVALSTVILAKRGSPGQGQGSASVDAQTQTLRHSEATQYPASDANPA